MERWKCRTCSSTSGRVCGRSNACKGFSTYKMQALKKKNQFPTNNYHLWFLFLILNESLAVVQHKLLHLAKEAAHRLFCMRVLDLLNELFDERSNRLFVQAFKCLLYFCFVIVKKQQYSNKFTAPETSLNLVEAACEERPSPLSTCRTAFASPPTRPLAHRLVQQAPQGRASWVACLHWSSRTSPAFERFQCEATSATQWIYK